MARKQKQPRLKLHEITAENDIRYAGPLNYQHFQILGWLCIAASQAVFLCRVDSLLEPDAAVYLAPLISVLDYAAALSLPLLLIANFAQILDFRNGYKIQLIKNAGASALVLLLSLFFTGRYIVGAVAAISSDPARAWPALETVIHFAAPNGFVCFNLFIDLLLCTLVMFFLNYRPRRFFHGRRLLLFRLLALLPIAYEVVCMVLKVQSAKGNVSLPLWSFPLLTVKPPMTFVLFLILAFYVKLRERRFRRHGKTHEEYRSFLKTRRNSWNFSVFLAIMMVVVSILDFAVMAGYSLYGATENLIQNIQAAAEATPTPTPNEEDLSWAAELGLDEETVREWMAQAEAEKAALLEGQENEPNTEALIERFEAVFEREVWSAEALGFGGSVQMLFLAPLVLLFSYTKKPRHPMAGFAIPPAAIVLILILYLEGIRELLWNLSIPKLDMDEIIGLLRSFSEGA